MDEARADSDTRAPSSGRGILRAALVVGAATLLVRLVGLLKNQSIAYWFGTGDEVEAFRLASMLLVFALGACSNALTTAFIPVYARERVRAGPAAAARLCTELMGWILPLLCGAALLLALAWPGFLALVAGGHTEAKRAMASEIFYWILPSLVLNGLSVPLLAALNAEKRFGVTAFPAGVVPLTIALSVWIFARAAGARALAAGHLLGVVLELLIVAWLARRAGLAVLPRRPRATRAVRDVFGQIQPLVFGAVLMSSTSIVDQMMCATLPSGNLAALGYAHDIVAGLLSITAVALGTVVLPYLSDLAAARDWSAMQAAFGAWARRSLYWSLPLTAFIVLLAGPLVSILFERGHFSSSDAHSVSTILRWYALQIPFFVVGILCARVLSALRGNQILMWVSGLNCAANVGLNWVLMRWMGASGIALSTTCVQALATLCLVLAARRRLRAAVRLGPE